MNAQNNPVGPHPDVATVLVGALTWALPGEVTDVLALVRDDDVADPATAAVLAAVRTLAGANKPCGPQLVADELRRTGQFNAPVADRLRAATTSGAAACAARHYAAATVAESLRRRVESTGHALISAAPGAAEAEFVPMVTAAASAIIDCAHRLEQLRGESL